MLSPVSFASCVTRRCDSSFFMLKPIQSTFLLQDYIFLPACRLETQVWVGLPIARTKNSEDVGGAYSDSSPRAGKWLEVQHFGYCCRLRSRTPGPPPFSSMNMMPEASKALRMARSLAPVSAVPFSA